MRVFDTNNIEMFDPDMTKGYMREDKLFIAHHEAVDEVAEIGHYETIAEYPNGGKDVEWVVDIPGVKARDAYDEYESILRYITFSEQELAVRRIEELKNMLKDTDYNILKIVEGATTLSDCADIIAKRAAWRKEINELEKRLMEGDQ